MEVVLAAVDDDGLALQHAADDLRLDPSLALRALEQDVNALIHVAERLKGDRGFALEARSSKRPNISHWLETLSCRLSDSGRRR